jgi:hypothetical protein
MKNLMENVKCMSALDAVSFTASTNGVTVDTAGYESLVFVLNVGAFATFTSSNKITVTVEEGDASNASDMAAVASGDYLDARYEDGTAWDKAMDNTGDDQQAFTIGVACNRKRYKRIVCTEGGTVVAPLAVVAILGNPRHAPANVTQAP